MEEKKEERETVDVRPRVVDLITNSIINTIEMINQNIDSPVTLAEVSHAFHYYTFQSGMDLEQRKREDEKIREAVEIS